MYWAGQKVPLLCGAEEPSTVLGEDPFLMSAVLQCCMSVLCCNRVLLLLACALSPLWEKLSESAGPKLIAWLRLAPLPPVPEGDMDGVSFVCKMVVLRLPD